MLLYQRVHPPKQTWNLKMDPWKRRFLLETTIYRFHVNFWGCKCFSLIFSGRTLMPSFRAASGWASPGHGMQLEVFHFQCHSSQRVCLDARSFNVFQYIINIYIHVYIYIYSISNKLRFLLEWYLQCLFNLQPTEATKTKFLVFPLRYGEPGPDPTNGRSRRQ